MLIDEGHLVQARQVASPNFDERPAGPEGNINLLVIHCISLPAGQYGTPWVEQLFTNQLDSTAHEDFSDLKDVRVSSHLFIRRDGEIVQFVPFEARAWHAGESNFQGRARCNDFSIGIELEGTDATPFTESQYEALIQVCQAIRWHYHIPASHVVGHSDIAPGRKTDPGTCFDWSRLNLIEE